MEILLDGEMHNRGDGERHNKGERSGETHNRGGARRNAQKNDTQTNPQTSTHSSFLKETITECKLKLEFVKKHHLLFFILFELFTFIQNLAVKKLPFIPTFQTEKKLQ